MIVSFKGGGTEDIYKGRSTKAARKTCPEEIWRIAQRRLDYLDAATSIADLRQPASNKPHPLKKEREGQHAIWINSQYRICFRWTTEGPAEVEITDYHD
jgi:toxin HigB-1